MSWPWGAYLGDEGLRNGIRAKISSWQRDRPERDPARRQGDRHLPQLDARRDRGEPRRLRRGDPAHRTTATSPTAPARTSSSSRTASIYTPDLSTVDPAGHHARHGHPDRAGPRLRGRREEPHPLRPLPRGRGLHVRHRRRGDADPRGRRRRDRRRADHAGDPEGVPRHRARRERALGALARVRRRPRPAEA